MLLEKAYAKAYGSYMRIIGGNPASALRDLTGAPSERREHKHFDSVDELWSYIHSAERRKWLLCCGSDSKAISEGGGRKETGIAGGHAYSILDSRVLNTEKGPVRLVQIRNPWAFYPFPFCLTFQVEASGQGHGAIMIQTGPKLSKSR